MSTLTSALIAINVPKEDFRSQSAKDRLLAAADDLVARFAGIRVVAKHRFQCCMAVVGSTDELEKLSKALLSQKLGVVELDDPEEPLLEAAYE